MGALDEDEKLHRDLRQVDRELRALGNPEDWTPGDGRAERYAQLQGRRNDLERRLRQAHSRND